MWEVYGIINKKMVLISFTYFQIFTGSCSPTIVVGRYKYTFSHEFVCPGCQNYANPPAQRYRMHLVQVDVNISRI